MEDASTKVEINIYCQTGVGRTHIPQSTKVEINIYCQTYQKRPRER